MNLLCSINRFFIVLHYSLYKLEDLPGCAGLREAWEVISLAKIHNSLIITNFSTNCRSQYQVQRCDKSNARTSFGDLKSKFFLGLLFSSILIFRICLSSMSLKEVPLGMYCRMSLLSNPTWGLSVEQ